MGDDRQFTIGKLSRLAGVGIETIRYYERIRLMPHPPRSQNGRRSFGSDGLEHARIYPPLPRTRLRT